MGAKALAQHWTCNPYAYRYDMTAYIAITEDGRSPRNPSDYEVAAFCGSECRGVTSWLSVDQEGTRRYYGYLRIHSNQQEGEALTVKVYSKSRNREFTIEGVSLQFLSLRVEGLPSQPLVIPLRHIVGETNNDGRIDVADVVACISYLKGESPAGFIADSADVDGNGIVDSADVTALVGIILNN